MTFVGSTIKLINSAVGLAVWPYNHQPPSPPAAPWKALKGSPTIEAGVWKTLADSSQTDSDAANNTVGEIFRLILIISWPGK